MSRVLNFEITLEEKTERKLKALAMLSPEAAQEVEGKLREFLQEKLAQYFDSTVSGEIIKKMEELDGKSYVVDGPKEEGSLILQGPSLCLGAGPMLSG